MSEKITAYLIMNSDLSLVSSTFMETAKKLDSIPTADSRFLGQVSIYLAEFSDKTKADEFVITVTEKLAEIGQHSLACSHTNDQRSIYDTAENIAFLLHELKAKSTFQPIPMIPKRDPRQKNKPLNLEQR